MFNAEMTGPEEDQPPQGTLEVGYQIGCGIDMSTSNGVVDERHSRHSVRASASAGLGTAAIDRYPDVLSRPSAGLSRSALKPGIINIVPVTKKEFKGAEPWVHDHRTSTSRSTAASASRSSAHMRS